jgi:hypothetical protein
MQRIRNLDDIATGLDALMIIDPRLQAIRDAAGEVPLRLSEPGFESLASIIVGQQVSTASARAIFGRLTALANPLTPQTILSADDDLFRQAGLSRPKQRGLAGAGAERGLPAAQLLPAVAVVLAGRDQGGVPRPGQHRRRIRAPGVLAELLDEAAERGQPEELREAVAQSGLHPLQRVPARPLPVPVLRHARGTDLRPRHSAPLRRGDDLGERRRRLLALQSAQGRHDAGAGQNVAAQKPFQPTVHDLHNNGRLFPPNYLHESWMDYLYWDVELEP